MTKPKLINLLTIILVSHTFASCSLKETKYQVYNPNYLSSNNEHKSFGSPQLNKEELKNTIQVFDYYSVDYICQGDSILITTELIADWELLWNYTSKSNDSVWLANHKVE